MDGKWMLMWNLTRPWCRHYIVDFCGNCDHPREHNPIRLVFGPGVVSQLWWPPTEFRHRWEFADAVAGAGEDWIAKVSHPAFMPPGYAPHDAGDG